MMTMHDDHEQKVQQTISSMREYNPVYKGNPSNLDHHEACQGETDSRVISTATVSLPCLSFSFGAAEAFGLTAKAPNKLF
jgi:hypothetical protein